MINFPVIRSLRVDDFGLYPGAADQSGLSVDFGKGLTLILGANGLGKSTLIQIIYRAFTGPYDISGLDRAVELGNMNTTPTLMVGARRATFANRDASGARTATATFACFIGDREVIIRRRLSDLNLIEFSIDGVASDSDEISYQKALLDLVGLSSFGDFILMLRHLINTCDENLGSR